MMRNRVARVCSVLCALLIAAPLLLLPSRALAWDSAFGGGSHKDITVAAYADLLSDPAVSAKVKSELRAYRTTIIKQSYNEMSHPQTFKTPSGLNYYSSAVGNNPGTNGIYYWWKTVVAYYRKYQSSHNTSYRDKAYYYLGVMVHDIEDMGSPPHAFYNMHGFSTAASGWGPTAFEILSAVTSYDDTFYKKPTWTGSGSPWPGKNIVDGTGTSGLTWHGDAAQLTFSYPEHLGNWRPIGSVNLQAPAPSSMCLDVSCLGVSPVLDYRVEYTVANPNDPLVAGSHYMYPDAGMNKALRYREFTNVQLNPVTWSRLNLADDDFEANSNMSISYRRPENGWVTRIGQVEVYVKATKPVTNEYPRKNFAHPWQYYDYLRGYTLYATSAPFWQGYGALTNDSKTHNFSLTWLSAPNSERALLSSQWKASELTVKWVLEAAQKKLDDRTYAVGGSTGSGYKVNLFADSQYNSHSSRTPEYCDSYGLAVEPGQPDAFTAPPRAEWLQAKGQKVYDADWFRGHYGLVKNWYSGRTYWGQTGSTSGGNLPTMSSGSLRFGHDVDKPGLAYNLSSMPSAARR